MRHLSSLVSLPSLPSLGCLVKVVCACRAPFRCRWTRWFDFQLGGSIIFTGSFLHLREGRYTSKLGTPVWAPRAVDIISALFNY
ncbi:hypothetical protein B0T18DRAFT_399251 [Schizothecium vesticola]|uniref:Uncharacterized protein n=1 Tax=Schizothecium vesticola TaxID=314040 RepID=A0AA40KD45_9PEZI|nr:hypothetical protein B0T18DRAFT_399251 [Schizothecium vesticola]